MQISPPLPTPSKPRIELLGVPRLVLPQGEPHVLERRDAALLAWLALQGPTPRSCLVTPADARLLALVAAAAGQDFGVELAADVLACTPIALGPLWRALEHRCNRPT